MTPVRVRQQFNESETKRKTGCVSCRWSSGISDPKLPNTLIENRWKINSGNFQKEFEKNLQRILMWLSSTLASPTWHFWPWYVPDIIWVFKFKAIRDGVPWFLPKFPLQGSPWICTFFSSSGFSRFSDSTNLKWKERWIEPQSTLSLQNTEWFLKKSHYRVVSGFVRTGFSFSGFSKFFVSTNLKWKERIIETKSTGYKILNEKCEIGSNCRQATSQTAGDRLEHHNSSIFCPQHAQFRVGG